MITRNIKINCKDCYIITLYFSICVPFFFFDTDFCSFLIPDILTLLIIQCFFLWNRLFCSLSGHFCVHESHPFSFFTEFDQNNSAEDLPTFALRATIKRLDAVAHCAWFCCLRRQDTVPKQKETLNKKQTNCITFAIFFHLVVWQFATKEIISIDLIVGLQMNHGDQ